MRTKSPRAVSELLTSAMPQLEDRLIEERLRRSWIRIVGPEIARRTRPASLVNGTLTVVVDNSPWLQELTWRAEELQSRVAAAHASVRTLRFMLGSLNGPDDRSSPAQDDARDAQSSRPSLGVAERIDIDAAAAAIPDPSLADAARQLLTKAQRWSAARGNR
jgi:hypothetical protein